MINHNDIERLFRGNYRPMFLIAYKLLHDEEVARDVVHNVFATLLEENLSSVNTSYLLQAVRFACLKYMRSLSVRERFIRAYALEPDETDTDSRPDEEEMARLNTIIDTRLPDRTREILKLRFIRRLKYREIAAALSISEVSVYKHLRNAICILRQYLKNDERQN